jgi:hypothetical protein
MYKYVRVIFVVKSVTITCFFFIFAALWWRITIFIVLLSLETVHDTVQYRYCIFSLLNRLSRITLKRQNPLLSYVREREKAHCKCTMLCTVHFIITFFNDDNVLLCVIYELNFPIFMYVTRISRYMPLYLYSLRYYPRFSVIAVGLGTYYPWTGPRWSHGGHRSTCVCVYIHESARTLLRIHHNSNVPMDSHPIFIQIAIVQDLS